MILNTIQIIAGNAFLLFIPGYLACNIFLPKDERLTLIASSIGLSISISIIFGFVLGLLGIFCWQALWAGLLIISAVFLCYRKRGKRELLRTEEMKVGVFVFTLLFAFNVILSQRGDLRFPQHFDEFQNIGIANDISATRKIEFLDYKTAFKYTNHDSFNRNLEFGFHVFLAELEVVGGIDLIEHSRFLPAFLTILIAAAMFAFIHTLTESFWAAIPAMMLYPTLDTNVTLLGPLLFVPITLAFFFVFLFFTSFIRFFEEQTNMHFILSILFAFSILLIHPPSLTLAMPIILLYVIMQPALIKKNKTQIGIYVGLGILGLFAASILFWRRDLFSTVGYLFNLLVFKKGWMFPDSRFALLDLTTWPIYAFAVIGIIYCILEKKYLPLGWGISSLFFFLSYTYFDITLFSPYHRAVHYLTLAAISLASLGIFWISKYLVRLDRKTLAGAFLITIVIPAIVHAYAIESSNGLEIREIIDEDQYDALQWIDRTYGIDNTIAINPPAIWALEGVSRNKKYMPLFEYSFSRGTGYRKTCYERFDGVDIVVAPANTKCDNYEEVFVKNDAAVYLVKERD